MQLTFVSEWVDHNDTLSTLTIGAYAASVYQNKRGDWWWSVIFHDVGPDSDGRYSTAGRGSENGRYAAKKAAQVAIRTHHAETNPLPSIRLQQEGAR